MRRFDTPEPDADECRCPCHRAPFAAVHVVACCERCPVCRTRIATGRLTEHLARHGREAPSLR